MISDAMLVAIVGGSISLVIAVVGIWIQSKNAQRFRREDRLHEERREKIERVLSYIDENAGLIDLYRLLGREDSWIVTDQYGHVVKDDQGRVIIERRSMEPDPTIEEALLTIKGTNIHAAIELQKVRLNLRQSEINDLLVELAPNANLHKELARWYLRSTHLIGLNIEHKDITGLGKALEESDQERRRLRKEILKLKNITDDRGNGSQKGG